MAKDKGKERSTSKKRQSDMQQFGSLIESIILGIWAVLVGIVQWTWKIAVIIVTFFWWLVSSVVGWAWGFVFGHSPDRDPASKREVVFSEKDALLRGVILSTLTFVVLALLIVMLGKFPRPSVTVGSAGAGFNQWLEVQAADDAVLNNYGWVDEEAGIVRIPIRDAMQMLDGKLPSRDPNWAGDDASDG
ncbi:MAG: hypothetical protein HC884_03160 [Chloroflexaceae bacterium]|nr:hypothetical protein [Chloroflexaceae bacterium]